MFTRFNYSFYYWTDWATIYFECCDYDGNNNGSKDDDDDDYGGGDGDCDGYDTDSSGDVGDGDNDDSIGYHHYHHFLLKSIFSHLGCGWMGNNCLPHLSIECHIFSPPPNKFISSITHSLHFFMAFLAAVCPQLSPPPPPPPPPTNPLCSFHLSKPSSSLPQLNFKVFTHLFHLTARPPILVVMIMTWYSMLEAVPS